MIRHYYHVYADGDWREPVSEHLEALGGLDPLTTVGIIGEPQNRAAVKRALSVLRIDKVLEADGGWEQFTLTHLWRQNLDGPVLYTHTKGAYDPSPINVEWRRSMTRHVVANWAQCLDLLQDVDAVGCHWIPPDDWPHLANQPFFGGNFWWANSQYLQTLPQPSMKNRHEAEAWIGRNNPAVHDLLPGWPSMELFGAAASA